MRGEWDPVLARGLAPRLTRMESGPVKEYSLEIIIDFEMSQFVETSSWDPIASLTKHIIYAKTMIKACL